MNEPLDFYIKGPVIGNPNPAGVRVPVNNLMLPINLVSEMSADNGVKGGKSTIQFAYLEAKLHKEGKGLLGFKSIMTKNLASGVTSVSNNAFNSTYFMFEPESVENFLTSTNASLSKTTYVNEFVDLGNKRFWFRQNSTTENNTFEGKRSTNTMAYDTDGNVLSSFVVLYANNIAIETATNTMEYVKAPASSLFKNKPTKVTVTKTRGTQTPYTVVTTFGYNTSTGFLENKTDYQTTFASAVTTSYTYNTMGNTTGVTVTPPVGSGITARTTSSVYDTYGRFPVSQTNQLGQTATSGYHGTWGKPTLVTGIDGLVTSFVYDDFGRLAATYINPNFNVNLGLSYTILESYIWDVNDIVGTRYYHWVKHPGKPDTKVYYDMLNRPVIKQTEAYVPLTVPITPPLWNTEKTSYDARGNVATSTTPYQGSGVPITTTNSYDIYNRLVTTAPSNTDFAKTTYEYSYSNGNLTSKVKTWTGVAAFQEKSSVTDASGKMISSTDYGGTLDFTYYAHGKVQEVKNGTTQLSYSEYDDHLNQTKLIDVNGGTTTYEYDALNQLKKQTNANGQVTTMVYDIMGRVTSRIEPAGTTTYEFCTTNVAPESINQLKKITGFTTGNTEEYEYDPLARLVSKTETININSTATAHTTSYTYTKYGDVLTMVYPSAFQVNYAYNANGYLETVKGGNSAATLKSIFTNNTMNSFNQYTKYTLGNGKISENTYNNGIPTSYYTAATQYLTFNWDLKTGNLSGRTDAQKNKTESFAYDNQNRLLTGAGGTPFTINYAANGNITSKTDAGSYEYTTPKINAVSKINCVANIPLLTQTVTYNDFFQPDKVKEGAFELNYTYSSDYQRIKSELKNNNVVTNTRYYFGDYEKDITAGTTRHIHYISAGQGLVAIVVREGATDSYFFTYTDYLGSILTVTDDAGAIVAEQSFDAWGRKRNPTNWTYTAIPAVPVWLYRGYTGHEHLPQFGLINMNGRMYDPVVGRMLSVDNYVHGGTQGFNRYSYAMNNPLKYTDPSGEVFILATIAIGAAIGGTFNLITHWNTPGLTGNKWADRLVAFGIGAGAGALAGATGGAAVGALGLGTTGFVSGAVAGGVGALMSSPTQQIANGVYFGDQFSYKEWGLSVLGGAALGGLIGGAVAAYKGQNFWWGNTPRNFNVKVNWTERQIVERMTQQELDDLARDGIFPSIDEAPGVAAKPQITTEGKGLQLHHFATNKNKTYTPEMENIAKQYGLDLDGDWNKMMLPHSGRHPNLYHQFVLDGMRNASQQAGSSQAQFLNLFRINVIEPIVKNPNLLYLKGWR
jgi:RHS repeat-associated protein